MLAKKKKRAANFPLLSILRAGISLCLRWLQGAQLPQPVLLPGMPAGAGRMQRSQGHPAVPMQGGGNAGMAVASSPMVAEGSEGFLQGRSHTHSPCATPCPNTNTLCPIPLLCAEAKATIFLKCRPEFCLKNPLKLVFTYRYFQGLLLH